MQQRSLLSFQNIILSCTLLCLGLVSGITGYAADPEKTPAADPKEPQPIAIIPQDGFNLEIVDQFSPYYVITKLTSPAHNWFAGTFTNLPTDKEVTIGLSMEDNDTKGNKADVTKWEGLCPVMTYADPSKYEAYEWFYKDEKGCWMSGDPTKQGLARFAGTGVVPNQFVIPAEVAEQFLSEDRKYWQPWREIKNVEVIPNVNIFRMKTTFEISTATLAMRYPFSINYRDQYLDRIEEAYPSKIKVNILGNTPSGHKISIVEVNPRRFDVSNQTVVIIAREHATEQDSSWVASGVISRLLEDDSLSNITWYIILVLDPDGATKCIHNKLTEKFIDNPKPIPDEVIKYTTWLVDLVNSGRTIDLVVDLHNVECNEGKNIESPEIRPEQKEFGIYFNNQLFTRLAEEKYVSGDSLPWSIAWSNYRLHGWCALRFGSLNLAYEINSRYPKRRLSIYETDRIGFYISDEIGKYLLSDMGKKQHEKMTVLLQTRKEQRDKWWSTIRHSEDQRDMFDLLVKGY